MCVQEDDDELKEITSFTFWLSLDLLSIASQVFEEAIRAVLNPPVKSHKKKGCLLL